MINSATIFSANRTHLPRSINNLLQHQFYAYLYNCLIFPRATPKRTLLVISTVFIQKEISPASTPRVIYQSLEKREREIERECEKESKVNPRDTS